MGLISRTLNAIVPAVTSMPFSIPTYQADRPLLNDAKYLTYAKEGYQKNELVFACIEELSTSAAEPKWMAKVGAEWVHEGLAVDILNRPNPFMDGYEFLATIIMHRALAGNAYALVVRSRSGKPVELWLLRPDRVSVVPHRQRFVSHYEYDTGDGDFVELPVEDVIHWKTRNPVNDFYGQPALMAIAGRVDIDNYMRDFVRTYFTNAGVPSGLLNVKGKLGEAARAELRNRHRQNYGGPSGWHELMIIDQSEASFTAMTANLGPQGLVIPELDEISEARICMAFGVPPELMGARVGMQNSSYAQKRSARESFWDETLSPLYREIAGPVNLRFGPNYPRISEIALDLSKVRALQEDVDKVHARLRADLTSGGITIEEFRLATGRKEAAEGTYLVPSNLVPVLAGRVRDGSLGEEPAAEPLMLPAGEPNDDNGA